MRSVRCDDDQMSLLTCVHPAGKDAVEADPAAVYIQEVRAKHERVNRTELRRIETYFEKLLSLKAQHDTLEQASHQKESKIIKNYEDRKYTSALNRLDQQVSSKELLQAINGCSSSNMLKGSFNIRR